MLEGLEVRVEALAAARVRARREATAERLAEDVPKGVRVEEVEEGVRLSGRGLLRRSALDPELRAVLGRLG